MVIAIDGPAGAGKSTVARELAYRLGFTYLDTGAMYRCVALLSLEDSGKSPAGLAAAAEIRFIAGDGPPAGERSHSSSTRAPRVLLDGRDVSAAIRAPEVSEAASIVAADPEVRVALVANQRRLIARGDWVADGRDIATVVAPAAELKVFLTADPVERARRRAAELGADQATVLAEQRLRDERDSGFGRSTLEPAPGAVTLDTTGMSVAQVVEHVVELVGRRRKSRPTD